MANWMWMIAGPNGAGKSTFARRFLRDLGHSDLVKLNADERTLELRQDRPDAPQDELNLTAAIAIDSAIVDLIAARQSFVVETVLSSGKYRDDVLAAKSAGLKIGLIYVSLHPPELSPQRVSERVRKGGHAVDAGKAIERYGKSHRQLTWFASRSDVLMVFDNSSSEGAPFLLASRVGEAPLFRIRPGHNPAVDLALSDQAKEGPPAT